MAGDRTGGIALRRNQGRGIQRLRPRTTAPGRVVRTHGKPPAHPYATLRGTAIAVDCAGLTGDRQARVSGHPALAPAGLPALGGYCPGGMPGRYGHDPGADQRRLDIAPQRPILACGGRQPVPLQCRGYRCVRQRPQGRRRAPADPGAQRELCGICLARTGRHFWELATQYARLSDGRRVMWSMARPFRLDTTPWSGSVDLLDQQLDLNFYERGARTWQLPSRERNYAVQWQRLIYGSGDTVFRLGLAARRARYSYSAPQPVKVGRLPAPTADERTLAGIGPGFNLHQDRYASFSNVQSVGRVEDHNLGWDVSGSLLYDSAALGATDDGPALAINATRGWQPTPDVLILAQGSFGGRRRGGQWRNADLRMAATAYGQVSSWQTLVAHADYASLTHPDPENRLYVGGFQALRGYPNFYASGSRRLRLTVADRLVSPTVMFNTFQLGYVVFVDAARVGGGPTPGWSPWYATAGAGLRVGNLRGAYNRVLYFTLAWPLRREPGVSSGLQVVVGNVIDF